MREAMRQLNEHDESFLRVTCFNHFEACFVQKIRRALTHETVVLHDEHYITATRQNGPSHMGAAASGQPQRRGHTTEVPSFSAIAARIWRHRDHYAT